MTGDHEQDQDEQYDRDRDPNIVRDWDRREAAEDRVHSSLRSGRALIVLVAGLDVGVRKVTHRARAAPCGAALSVLLEFVTGFRSPGSVLELQMSGDHQEDQGNKHENRG